MSTTNTLRTNLILDADSYKLSHAGLYPTDIQGMFAYVEPRIKGETMIPFGLQMWVQKTLLTPITKADIDEAETFAKAHGEPFDRGDWEYILERYHGHLPLTIRAVPEGMRVPSQNILVSVECTDLRVYWLAMYVETSLQRGFWYPTSIATNDYKAKRVFQKYLRLSADNEQALPFMLHDFGGRGVSSEESAQVGGAAHLVNFMGSDTISGVRAANFYYDSPMSAFSVPATEHSIQCAWGPERQEEYLKAVLDKNAKPNAILSVVLDGYDVYREAELLCTKFRQQIIDSGARVVFRPDSGDPLEVIPRILAMQEVAFGYTVNSKGFKVLNHVGIIQGDGVDTDAIDKILAKVTHLGYSAVNLVFGSGGALLQKVNRDTYKFAQKASAVLVRGEWVPIFKDPVTDPGKKSKAGRLTLYRSRMTNELVTGSNTGPVDGEWMDMMELVYHSDEGGVIFNKTTLDEVRARVNAEK